MGDFIHLIQRADFFINKHIRKYKGSTRHENGLFVWIDKVGHNIQESDRLISFRYQPVSSYSGINWFHLIQESASLILFRNQRVLSIGFTNRISHLNAFIRIQKYQFIILILTLILFYFQVTLLATSGNYPRCSNLKMSDR